MDRIKRTIKFIIRYLLVKLKFIWQDFRKFGKGLGRKGEKKLEASFYGDVKKFPIYMKRRAKNKNLKARRLKNLYRQVT